jgi:formylglycine-generating enzyme required for sulfatase activity
MGWQLSRGLGGNFHWNTQPGAVALVFYAGHGVQIKGENYFPSVDAEISSEEDVPNQSISIKQIMDVLDESKTQLNLVFLDACRNNPFSRSFRSAEEGLARVTAPSGTLISYATRPGSVAADGSGRNGLYTSKLLKQLDSNQQIEQSLKMVVSEVKAASLGKQEPWMEGSIEGNFCFVVCGMDIPAVPPQQPISAGLDSAAVELSFWDSIKSSTDPADFQAYLSKYPNGQFEVLARNRLKPPAPVAVVKPEPVIPSYVPADTNTVEVQPSTTDRGSSIEMVRLPTGISMGKYEVTPVLWRAIMGYNPSKFSACGDSCPVGSVSYDEITQFLQDLNSLTGKRYRLPTEDEWFSACQAGSNTQYCGSNGFDEVAWFNSNSSNKAHPVGQKQPNAYGLYDMSGNVWEWTNSLFEVGGSRLVVRGGSWHESPTQVRSAFRVGFEPTFRGISLGFRLALDN